MKRLIIGTSQRTGSTLLVDSLAVHPEASSASEWFYLDRPGGHASANLLKLFSTDEGFDTFQEVLASGTVVFLYREDREAQIRSFERALSTGVWTAEEGKTTEIFPPMPREHIISNIERAEQLFRPRASLLVSYEEMIGNWDATIAKILGLMGWERRPIPMMRSKMIYRSWAADTSISKSGRTNRRLF